MSLGGDVIVEGVVEGDVATIGGSVIQSAGARIGGDVIVLGGSYRVEDTPANRNPAAMTMMYAGYQQELRHDEKSDRYLQSQMDANLSGNAFARVLFWFLVSLRVHSGDARHDQPRSRACTVNQLACSLRLVSLG